MNEVRRAPSDLSQLVRESLPPVTSIEIDWWDFDHDEWRFRLSLFGKTHVLRVPLENWEDQRADLISLLAHFGAPAPEATLGGKRFWIKLEKRVPDGDGARYEFSRMSHPRESPEVVAVRVTATAEAMIAARARRRDHGALELAVALWVVKDGIDHTPSVSEYSVDSSNVEKSLVRRPVTDAEIRLYVAAKLYQAYQAGGKDVKVHFAWIDHGYLGVREEEFKRTVSLRDAEDWVINGLALTPTKALIERCDAEAHASRREIETRRVDMAAGHEGVTTRSGAREELPEMTQVREKVSEQDRILLDYVWKHFREKGDWISTKRLHQKFGKPAVLEALKRMSGSIVFMSGQPGKERYHLTILGVLLTSDGQNAEALLMRYLEYLRQRFARDPDVESVSGKEVQVALDLTPEDTKVLGCLIDLGRLWGNTSGDLGRNENWSAGVPPDIDDLPDVSDLGAYVSNRALEGYDPNLPAGASERMRYMVMRQRDGISQGAVDSPFDNVAGLGPLEEVTTGKKKWDAFVCHAGEDKAAVVEPLAAALDARGLQVWYDRWELKIGDSLRRKIEEGLANSRFGIVILSPAFFKKEWPQKELDGLVQREVAGEKVILPVWHGLSHADVARHSLLLADRVAGSTENGIEDLADELLRAMGGHSTTTHSVRAGVGRVKDVGTLERLAGPSIHPSAGSQPILEEAQRTRRGLVLAALLDFADLVRQVCDGLTIRGQVKADFTKRIGSAADRLRRVREEQSQWIGPDWVERIDRLERLAWQIVTSFSASYENQGPVAARFSEQGAAHCEEFDRLYQQLRRGGLSVTQRLSNEEREMLCQAAGNKGEIYKLYTDQTDYFVRVGDRNYITDERPNLRVKYLDALDRLIEKHLARHESDKLYSLTAAGWDAAEEVCKDLPRSM